MQDPHVSKASLAGHIPDFIAALEDSVVSSKAKSARQPFIERFRPYNDLADFEAKAVEDISSSGYVVHSLEAALWAFFTTETFREGAIKVVNLGDDADTVGAIYGGLAGAFYGDEEVPEEWLRDMKRMDLVEEVVRGVVEVVQKEAGKPTKEEVAPGIGERISAGVEALGV